MKHLFFAATRSSGQPAPGTWKLPAGRAMTLSPREAGVLQVVYGEVWATFDGPHEGPLNDWGDHVVRAGERLRVPPGRRLVVESWRADAPAFLSWEPERSSARSTPAAPARAATCAAS